MTAAAAPAPLLGLALTVRFVLELALLAGVGVLAWQIAVPWQWVAVVAAPLVVAVVWGLFISPKAVILLPGGARFTIEAALFLGAGTGLLVIGLPAVALIGVTVWFADRITLALLGPDPGDRAGVPGDEGRQTGREHPTSVDVGCSRPALVLPEDLRSRRTLGWRLGGSNP